MNKLIKISSLLLFFCLNSLFAQLKPENFDWLVEKLTEDSVESAWVQSERARIYPNPKSVNYSAEYFALFDMFGNPRAVLVYAEEELLNAANVLNKQLSNFNYPVLPIVNGENTGAYENKLRLRFSVDKTLTDDYNDQAYKIEWNGKEVSVTGASVRGALYGAASLSQLVAKRNGEIVLRKAEVFDYPKFTRRFFNARALPYHLKRDLDWMLRYKMGAVSFQNMDYSWYAVDDRLQENLEQYKEWSDKYGGVDAAIILNLYRGEYDIEISNEEHIEKLKKVITTAYEYGVDELLLFADDAPPFEYGEGYVLTSERDKEVFDNMAEANCFLVNHINDWQKENNYGMTIMYAPGFYTYEEMHYGDMELFKDTPWEEDAYGPLKKELSIIGKNMTPEADIFWTGVYVCSQKITEKELADWTNNLEGRVPFLFDNSIFAHHEMTASALFTAYDNELPENFSEKTGGNGIFINGDALGESSKAASMTCNAYMWEGDQYIPKSSLIDAMIHLYGKDLLDELLAYKEYEHELRKIIKQREVWFTADELWKAIRDTRFTTEKNPYYYHLNYTRFKALRLQLKNSVPEPESIDEFEHKCIMLDKARRNLINLFEVKGFKKLAIHLESEMIELPEFNKLPMKN